MSVNAATINQQILTQQFTTQQTAQQASSGTENTIPTSVIDSMEVNGAGYELYFFFDAMSNGPSPQPTAQETVILAQLITQFVTACNTDTADGNSLNQSTQNLLNSITNTPVTLTNGTQTTIYQLAENVNSNPDSLQAIGQLQSIFNFGDPQSTSWTFQTDLQIWKDDNPEQFSDTPPAALGTLINQWHTALAGSGMPNLHDPTTMETLAQDIVNVNTELSNEMQTAGYLTPMNQVLYDVLNSQDVNGVSLESSANEVVTDYNSGNPNANYNSALSGFETLFQDEQGYIMPFLQEANTSGGPSNYLPINGLSNNLT